ncbi:MAG TPA: NAD-dependent protein deacetylase [Spirochaetia bacterium]|nr:NAD-dependent protein deacetylase [Spirochaetia bacterium]
MAVSSSGLTASLSPIVDLLRSRTTCVLTGAGISTESGIPDYRGPERAGRPATPITLKEFLTSAEARRRYWARSAIGWPWMESKRPNPGHDVVASLERSGICHGLITQNVDGLHRDAGSRAVVELHGALRSVVCLDCTKTESRYSLQERILVQNPGWMQHAGDVAPDGDVHLDAGITASFRVPACLHCGGTIKPDVVFFGESVPAARVERAFSMLAQAEALLVLGSSLTVYSGYRFVVAAVKQEKPVMIVNDGPTRADAQATAKVEARLGDALAYLGSTLDLV